MSTAFGAGDPLLVVSELHAGYGSLQAVAVLGARPRCRSAMPQDITSLTVRAASTASSCRNCSTLSAFSSAFCSPTSSAV